VLSFKDHIARQGPIRQQVREDAGDVHITSSLGFDAASVSLPTGISLGDRAARMNAFWRTLVEFQHQDVLVVALCVGGEG
jgi:hypothetical protein